MKKNITKIFYGAFWGALAAVFVWLLDNYIAPGLMYEYEARTYDWRVRQKVADVPDQSIENIVVIDIDGRSVSELGKFYQWPRRYYPQIIDYLDTGGAAAIGLDIIFDRDIWRPEEDKLFINSVRRQGHVYNALYFGGADSLNFRYAMKKEPAAFEAKKFYYEVHSPHRPRFRKEQRLENEFFELLNASRGVGHVNFNADIDGVVRSIHLFTDFNDHLYPSLALRIYMDMLGADSIAVDDPERLSLYGGGRELAAIPIDERGNMLINYYGTYKTFRYISFYDILSKNIDAEYFRDKVFLVGTSLAGLFDLRSTPILQAFPGVEIHANILNTLINGDFVRRTQAATGFIITLLIGAFLGILISYMSPFWSIMAVLLTGAGYVVTAAILFFDQNIWLDIVNPLLTIIFTFSLTYVYRFATEERKKRFIRSTFSHFVTKSVVDELLANPEKIKLGGEKKNCTVFFSDVAGFTSISERLTPEALVSLLNDYLTQMTNIVFKYNGMLDKYEGDAIMAVFGAPVSHGNDAYNACAAALEMQETLRRMRDLWRKQGKDELHARMGINTGPMVVGNMGSETRFDYTVMGDAVNLGARLEPANKQYGTLIMIGDETRKQAGDLIIVRQLDLLRVKGKNEPVKVYELVGTREKGISEDTQRVLELFRGGFEAYLGQSWAQALNYFEQALAINPNDGPSKRYVQRCRLYVQKPPAPDWDGVFTMTTK
ncbi:MAG TPA: adenylate/guanylate cyclase domain-containing protein [Caldithrix abyssi]|uniref:Adenylate/guanylate cyclase domain-containing protein n=1 Tax=Caldithrix abyssi TaxID=187145 RepID=A0A7V1LPP7_CALAY|nr:adenylate/guanylate cyclase domain-containing protein [Caldithrix abyssi]